MNDNGKEYVPDLTILDQYPVDGWKWPRIAIFVPQGRAWPGADKCWPRINEIARSGVKFFYHPSDITHVVRQRVSEGFLLTDYEYILMLDNDHRWPLDIVQRMARWVILEPKRRIIAGLYFNRREPYLPMAWKQGDDGLYYQLADWPKGLIEQIDLVGTGCIMIHREVFETLERPWFWYDHEGIQTEKANFIYPTEDIWFCKRARAAGFQIDLDTTIHAPHMGESWADEQTYRDYEAAHPEELNEPELIR